MDFSQFVNSFIALLVISNPLSALPAVLKVTRQQTLIEKKKTGLTASIAIFVIMLLTTWIGTPLLLVLGISIPAFQVAGGVIIFMMAMSMLAAEDSPIKQTAEEQKEKLTREDSGAIVPLAIPLIAGPGSMSAIIVKVSQFPGIYNLLLISVMVLLVSLVLFMLLYFASTLERLLGQSRINIINRLGGLVLAAIAIQTLANGVKGIFPALAAS